jgi:hypothetical protein
MKAQVLAHLPVLSSLMRKIGETTTFMENMSSIIVKSIAKMLVTEMIWRAVLRAVVDLRVVTLYIHTPQPKSGWDFLAMENTLEIVMGLKLAQPNVTEKITPVATILAATNRA